MAAIDWFRPPRSVLTLYLAGAVTAMACLTWLTIRQLNSDELADAQRAQQRLGAVADRVLVRVQQGLAVKTPTLREVARTAPYMHDGSLATLEDVVEFYNGGGRPNPNSDIGIRPLVLSSAEKVALAAFLRSLSGRVTEGPRADRDPG